MDHPIEYAGDYVEFRYGFGGRATSHGLWRRLLRRTIHFLAYHFILKRRGTRATKAAGFQLTVRPSVFDPRYFITSEFFASFIGQQDFSGRRVADIGTGSGILALAALRAGASSVVAVDVNPAAALNTAENARANGFDGRVVCVGSNLLSAFVASPLFDVVLSSPPSFPGEPRDMADRAWHAGPDYRDIAAIFEQVRERLAPGGRVYILLSSDSDLDRLSGFMTRARFKARRVAERTILIESLIIYELEAG